MNKTSTDRGSDREACCTQRSAAAFRKSIDDCDRSKYRGPAEKKTNRWLVAFGESKSRRKGFVLATLIGALACCIPGRATAAGTSDLHFDLQYSADDQICTPITRIYDSRLQKLIVQNNLKAPPGPGGWSALETNFEVTDPKEFAQAGLILPPTLAESERNASYVYDVVVPGTDGRHPVYVFDSMVPGHSNFFVSELVVLKTDTVQADLDKLVNASVFLKKAEVLDTAKDSDLTTKLNKYLYSNDYTFSHINDGWHVISKQTGIGGSVRFFLREQKEIVIIDTAADLRRPDSRAIVLILENDQSGMKNLCVLWLDPTHSLKWLRDR